MAQVSVKFKPYNDSDDIKDYFECLQFTMNSVEEDKQVALLGRPTY